MPKTVEKVSLEYSEKIKLTKTTFLESSEIELEFTMLFDLEESDIPLKKQFEKEFNSAMDKQVKGQLAELNGWLAEKNKLLASLVDGVKQLDTNEFPSAAEAKKRQDRLKKMEADAKEIDSLSKDWNKIVEDWCKNVTAQQARVAVTMAIKAARLKELSDKEVRINVARGVKVTLVLIGVAFGIAAIVASAGAASPVVAAIALAGVGLGVGAVSTASQGLKAIRGNITVESRIMGNVAKDVETIREALGMTDGAKSSIAKHVTELSNLIKVREGQINDLTSDLQKLGAQAKSMQVDLGKVNDPTLAAAAVTKLTKALDGIEDDIVKTTKEMSKLEAENKAGTSLLNELDTMLGTLDKLRMQEASTLLGNVKKRVATVDGWLDIGSNVGNLLSAGSAL